eukprot:bmy_07748T0
MIFVLMGCSVFMTAILKFIPMPVLYGVFLYMGVSSLQGIQVLALVFVRKVMDLCFSKRELSWLDDLMPESKKKKLDDAKKKAKEEEEAEKMLEMGGDKFPLESRKLLSSPGKNNSFSLESSQYEFWKHKGKESLQLKVFAGMEDVGREVPQGSSGYREDDECLREEASPSLALSLVLSKPREHSVIGGVRRRALPECD